VINPGKALQKLCMLLLLVTASLSVQAQQQRVDVELSTHRVSIDETVILNVRAYGLDAELISSALDKEFDVTNRSSARQVNIINGKRTSIVDWVLELSPKRTGALEIPPIIVGSEQSRPLTLLVEEPASGAARDVFLEASVDITDPYVQAQVIYTLRVYQDVQFLKVNLELPALDDFEMQQISEPSSSNETVEGRNYLVSEIRYSVVPKQSGQFTIPAVVLQALVAANQNQVPNTRTQTRRLKRRANEVELNVQPRPDGMAGSWWLPAKAVNLQSEWSSPVDAMEVDQPVTRTIQILAAGVSDEQLPELNVPEVDNVSIYADKPTSASSINEQGLISQQTNTWAVIPQKAGELVLPEMKVNWFDTTTGEAREAVLPAETITVVDPAATAQAKNDLAATVDEANSADQADSASQGDISADDSDAIVENLLVEPSENTELAPPKDDVEAAVIGTTMGSGFIQSAQRWRNVAIALVLGWVLSLLGLWLWIRRRYSAESGHIGARPGKSETSTMRFQRRAGSRAALEPIKEACDTADASKISKEVLSWATMVWPDNAPTHISAVANRLKSPELAIVFSAVDAQQYRPTGSVKALAVDEIPALLKRAVDQYQHVETKSSGTNALPSL